MVLRCYNTSLHLILPESSTNYSIYIISTSNNQIYYLMTYLIINFIACCYDFIGILIKYLYLLIKPRQYLYLFL